MTDIIGALSSRVSVHRAYEAEGAMGRKVGVRILIDERWASVRPDRGTTALEGRVPVDRCDLIVTLRTGGVVDTLTIEDRIVYPARTGDWYRITTIEPGNRLTGRRTLHCVREARRDPAADA